MRSRALWALFSVALAGCGSAPAKSPASAAAPTTTQSATAAAPVREAQPSNVLRRSALREVTSAGLGAFLQHVSLDDHPVFVAGKFHGFRITGLSDPSIWRGVDLRAGDVVTGVNGFTIERPENALEAFKSLEVASELRVDYERDGVPRELRYAIDEDAGAAVAPPAAAPPPGAPPPAAEGPARPGPAPKAPAHKPKSRVITITPG